MEARKLVDIITPEHFRTSCSDEDLSNAFYFNEDGTQGRSRCSRCSLLHILELEGDLPDNFDITVIL